MQSDNIRFCVEGIQIHINSRRRNSRVLPYIIGQDPAAETGKFPDHLSSYPACSHNSHSKVFHFTAH